MKKGTFASPFLFIPNGLETMTNTNASYTSISEGYISSINTVIGIISVTNCRIQVSALAEAVA